MSYITIKMIFLWLFLVFVIAVLGVWYYFFFFKYEKYLKYYPGPRPLPLLGNALEFPTIKDILIKFMEYQKEYGTIFKLRLGPEPPRLVISDCKTLETILGSTTILYKGTDYRFFHRWLGSGLLTSAGDKWRAHRKILTPAFHFTILEQFIATIDSVSDVLIEKLANEVGKDSVNIVPFISLCSLDIMCETSMGTSVDAQNYSESIYVRSVKEMCRILMERVKSPIKMFDVLYSMTEDYKIEENALNVLHNTTRSVISKRKKELLEQPLKVHDDDDDGVGRRKKAALLDLMLKYKMEGKDLSDEDIREEVDTFMFEGHDTTSSALSFALYCISNHPDVQENIEEELKNVLGTHDHTPTMQDLQDMKYLDAVIKETLRLYPSVPLISRHVHKDTTLDGRIIPKGSTFVIFTYGMHRLPEHFPNPEKFDPNRFLEGKKAHPYAYIPFSAGPRNCIGQKFAIMEIKLVLSKILRNFKLYTTNPPHEVEVLSETILKSANGVCIRLQKREILSK